MREHQKVIFAGPFGCTILDARSKAERLCHTPARVINAEVAAWRLGKTKTNPQSAVNADELKYRYQDSAIYNETNNNEYRADHPPEPVERRHSHARSQRYTYECQLVPADAGEVFTTNPDYVTPVIHRRVRREPVAIPRVLGLDTSRVSESDLAYFRAIECRLRATNTARANAICAALRLARIIEAEQHLV